MKKILGAIVRFHLTLVLLYLSIALGWTMVELPANLDRHSALLPGSIGFASGLILFSIGCRFLALYVVGHELTHWLAAKLFLRKTGTFRVGSASGCVAVERPNVWIVLAPYFIPVYTLIWIGFYGVFCFWHGPATGRIAQLFHAGVGFSYAFHTVLTFQALLHGQQDLRLYGRTFSLSLILFCNLAILLVCLIVASRQFSYGTQLFARHVSTMWQPLSIVCHKLWLACIR